MFPLFLALQLATAASAAGAAASVPPPQAQANANIAAAGVLRGGLLSLALELRTVMWYPEEQDGPGHLVHAFAEPDRPALVPGPLVRVRAGTVIQVTVRNTLDRDTLVVHGFFDRPGTAQPVAVPPGGAREVRFRADVAGTYYYWATTTGARTLLERYGSDSQLTGALIVDPADAPPPRDRIFVIGFWGVPDSIRNGFTFATERALVVNGRSWPHTERFTHTVGDSVRWRWINGSDRPHPMHLHGFYFRVDSRGDAAHDTLYSAAQQQLVVTESVLPGNTFSLLWVPERAGNWLMHCHTLGHIAPDLRRGAHRKAAHAAANHALEVMAGLALGIEVRAGSPASDDGAATRAARSLRLVANELPGKYGEDAGLAFALEDERGSRTAPSIPGPPIVLTQGEPVRITVVNRMREPTSVHWHGIELASYYDGVSGWSGRPGRVAPAIAPRDSFTVEFTPPRAGTFIYHTHFDEERQLTSGLYGALVVLEPGEAFDARRDRILVLSTGGPRRLAPMLLNGDAAPALELDASTTYRLRLININPNGVAGLSLLDSSETPVQWRVLKKDGAPVPAAHAAPRAARLRIGVGETYDLEYRAEHPAELRLEVRNRIGTLLLGGTVRVRAPLGSR